MTLTCDRHRAGRIERDNYPTPAWCTRRILERLGSRLRGGLHMGEPYARWIEPCAGEGAIVRELHARREELGIAWLDACDVRTETRAALLAAGVQSVRVGSDACMWLTAGAPWRVAITNPPFSDAERIAKAMRAAAHHVVLLTRLNWLASARAPWLRADMPDVYVLPERPNFVASLKCKGREPCGWECMQPISDPRPRACPGCGSAVSCSTSDGAEYCWLHWHGHRKTSGCVEVLPATPREERRT